MEPNFFLKSAINKILVIIIIKKYKKVIILIIILKNAMLEFPVFFLTLCKTLYTELQ